MKLDRARANRPHRQSGMTASVIVGVLLALMVVGIGTAMLLARPTLWTTRTTLLVSPTTTANDSSAATLYELLSQGKIAETYASLMRNTAFGDAVIEAAGVSGPAGTYQISAAVVPQTFLIRVTTSAPTRNDALALGSAAAAEAPGFVTDLSQPFSVRSVNAGQLRATRTGGTDATLLGIVAVIALVVGVLGQQAMMQLLTLRRARRGVPRSRRGGVRGVPEVPVKKRAAAGSRAAD
jgi:capsular polysaccharide biosynthesis protein